MSDIDSLNDPKVRAKARAAVKAMEKAAEALKDYAVACVQAGETIREHGDSRRTLQRDLREFASWLDTRLENIERAKATGSAA